MSVLAFIAAIAWPITILVIALIYYRPIYVLLHHVGSIAGRAATEPFKKVTAGKFEIEFKDKVDAKNPKSVEDAVATATDVAKHLLPYGVPVPDKPGLVIPPFGPPFRYVSVQGYPPNFEVKDPYTGKIFLVPPMPWQLGEGE
jgi:hypothetical protein